MSLSVVARNRPMPTHHGARLDEASAALQSLREERRRLERLGFERPLAQCHHQLRYWEFVTGLLSLPPRPRGHSR